MAEKNPMGTFRDHVVQAVMLKVELAAMHLRQDEEVDVDHVLRLVWFTLQMCLTPEGEKDRLDGWYRAYEGLPGQEPPFQDYYDDLTPAEINVLNMLEPLD